MLKKFWMVWRAGGGAPTVQHPTFEAAQKESDRLAASNPGVVFAVLEAKGATYVALQPPRWIEAVVPGEEVNVKVPSVPQPAIDAPTTLAEALRLLWPTMPIVRRPTDSLRDSGPFRVREPLRNPDGFRVRANH